MRIEFILKEVERLRELMHETAIQKGISHPEVLLISQKLDKWLNAYDKKYKGKDAGCQKSIGKITMT